MTHETKDHHLAYGGVHSVTPCTDQPNPCVGSGVTDNEPIRGILFHHQNCRKSSAVVELLMAANVYFDVIDYMHYPPSIGLLEALLDALKLPAHALLRTQESEYADLHLSEASDVDTILSAIQHHPVLMQRPIFWLGSHAVIGRPPEQVLTLIKAYNKR
jgi:arsenate reductase